MSMGETQGSICYSIWTTDVAHMGPIWDSKYTSTEKVITGLTWVLHGVKMGHTVFCRVDNHHRIWSVAKFFLLE